MFDLLVYSSKSADCDRLNIPQLSFSVQACRKYYVTRKQNKRPYLEPVFGLSILGCCRNIMVQHDRLSGRELAASVDVTAQF